jgi:transcription initiation factor TFIID subunit 8
VSNYQVLREKAASQRRDVERALTRFMAKTGETQSLFKDDVSTFPRELSASGDSVLHL